MYPSPTSSSSSSYTSLVLPSRTSSAGTSPTSTAYPSTISLSSSHNLSTTSTPSSSRSKPAIPIPPQPRLGRLGPKCLPGGRLEKYNQPSSAVIPYPRGETNLMECIEHRRGIRALGKMEGLGFIDGSVDRPVVIVRHKTVGGTAKRVWGKVAFWDKGKKGERGAEADGRDYGFDEDEDEWE